MERKPLNILAIEDNEFVKIFLKDVFWIHRGSGDTFAICDTLEKAWDIIADDAKRPNVIFLDLEIPEETGGKPHIENGFRFLENIRKDPRGRDISVLVFFEYGDKKIKERALASGAKEFLVKGEELPNEIVRKMEETLAKPTA